LLGTVFEPPEMELRIAESQMEFDSDRFCAAVIPLMWLENRDDSEIRAALARLCIGFHYEAVEHLFIAASKHRVELGEDFDKLVHLAARWSICRARISTAPDELEGSKELTVKQLYQEFDPTYQQFIDGSLSAEVPAWQSMAHTFCNDLYTCEQHGQNKAYLRSTGMDLYVIKSMYNWLPTLNKAENPQELQQWINFWRQCTQLISWQMSDGSKQIDEIDGMPYQFDEWLFERLPEIILSCESAAEARTIWEPILSLGAPAHYWITAFFSNWFSASHLDKTNEQDFMNHWREMIVFARSSESWQKSPNCQHYENIWDALFGVEELAIAFLWKENHSGIVTPLILHFEYYATNHLEAYSIGKVAKFLTSNSAINLRNAGVIWIEQCIDRCGLPHNSDDIEQCILALVKLVLEDAGTINKLPKASKSAMLKILKLLAERQNTIAMAIYDKITN
jgi:hypothetical protein